MFLKPLALVTLSTLLITFIALHFKTDTIEADLSSRVSEELHSKGYSWPVVRIDGRNIKIEGTAPNADLVETVIDLTTNIHGVYRVSNKSDLAVKSKAVPPIASSEPQPQLGFESDQYKIAILFNEKKVDLRGHVPNPQLKKEIVRLARSLSPTAEIIDDLTLNSSSPNNWRTVFGLGFSQLSRLKSGQLKLEDNMLHLSGKAWSKASISSIQQIFYAGLPDPYLAELNLGVVPPGSVVEQAQCQSLVDRYKENSRVFFDTGSARIKRRSYGLLDRLSYAFKRCPGYKVRIEGHTDNKGPGERNWRLSKDRAESVKLYLVRSGLNVKRIFTRGYGEARPIASNREPEGRAINRRIELIVTKRKFVEKKGQ